MMKPKSVLHMPEHLVNMLGNDHAFDHVMQLDGEVFRDVPGRRTIKVELAGKSYFIKQHFGAGWNEIFKNLATLRWPILSAKTEWRAIQKLDKVGIPTTPGVALGCRGSNPAHLQSFLITEDLGDIISLETLCAGWPQNPPDARFKRRLILEVARIARTLHGNGMNHRDFYICHFCLDNKRLALGEIYIYLIDLHRVGIRNVIEPTARMKDMAALYFSAMSIGLTRRDFLRFLRAYTGNLRHSLKEERGFWGKVEQRAQKLYFKFHGMKPSQIASEVNHE